jgi:hypothetical protein
VDHLLSAGAHDFPHLGRVPFRAQIHPLPVSMPLRLSKQSVKKN